jgi:hypothetical protein
MENNVGNLATTAQPRTISPRRDEVQIMPVREFSSENTLSFERLATLALTARVTLSWVDSLPAGVSGVNDAEKVSFP